MILLVFVACNRGAKKNTVAETRTSGTSTLLVDESFARVFLLQDYRI